MIYSKTQAAFTLSALKLFDEQPRVYFWTFTLVKVVSDWRAMQAFMGMFRQLYDWHGSNLFGLRVVECHVTHGLHFHALLATRMSVHIARRAGKRFGFGRVHVKIADRGSILYLCKYLSKERNLLPGARAWACVGGFRGVKVRNIEVDSLFHRNMKTLTAGKRSTYLYARNVYRETQLWGHHKNWQKSKQEPVRTYFLKPASQAMFQPRHKIEIDGDWHETYPAAVFWRKRLLDSKPEMCENNACVGK